MGSSEASPAHLQADGQEAVEKVSYGIPTYARAGHLVHFAGFTRHIGFYPTPKGIEAFRGELGRWTCTKGAVQFPLDQPSPPDLIRRIVDFRVEQTTKGIPGETISSHPSR